jgi:SnoaL-like domain
MTSDREIERCADGALERLVAKQAITEVIHRYCRGLDRMDRPLADTVWHPGGTADYGPGFRGTGAAFLDFVWDVHARYECHSHLVANTLIELDLSEGSAGTETYVAVWLRAAPKDGLVVDQFHRGRYVDSWSCRGGVWAIDHRQYVGDVRHETVYSAHDPAWTTLGARDPTDPSYEVLAGLHR